VKIVADTGPIIGLAKIGRVSLLKKLAKEVLIPPIVHKELYGKIGAESDQIDQALSDFVHVVELGSWELNLDEHFTNLGEGEKQSIILASTLKREVLLLIDDRAGRQAAESLNIPKIGLVGILLLSKKRGLIDNVVSLLHELRAAGYWLSDEVIAVARKLAEE
jgi:predicted nucleic acid-binding protein